MGERNTRRRKIKISNLIKGEKNLSDRYYCYYIFCLAAVASAVELFDILYLKKPFFQLAFFYFNLVTYTCFFFLIFLSSVLGWAEQFPISC